MKNLDLIEWLTGRTIIDVDIGTEGILALHLDDGSYAIIATETIAKGLTEDPQDGTQSTN